MNNPMTGEGKRDLVLAPGQYAYLQDTTRGHIKTYLGPTVINQTGQDQPVKFNPERGSFELCTRLEEAVRQCPVASEGDYIVLTNPIAEGVGGNTPNDKHPKEGTSSAVPTLSTGRKENIAGPATFALWPGQSAVVIQGHNLRSNEYLVARVYNEEAARRNQNSGVVRTRTEEGETPPTGVLPAAATAAAAQLTIGQLLIIKGTEVSFYIPPTGVEVLEDETTDGSYVRDAVTLEQLEYAILVDEDGNKRYEKGPQVVFPKPTEEFFTDDAGNRKFRAIELNPIQGIHVKVIAAYEEEDGTAHEIGEELFIKGDETAIYYPRTEHSIIQYCGQKKHYSTAIPNGEGRYVMKRKTGDIRIEQGPKMLLPDPRDEVIVRRVLSDKQVALWYPNNVEALRYNQGLREYLHQLSAQASAGGVGSPVSNMQTGFLENAMVATADVADYDTESYGASEPRRLARQQRARSPQNVGRAGAGGDTFNRGNTYTQPRTITLDTKYEGVPSVSIWTGFAVMVVSKSGSRRVEVGPKTVLLEYDEDLEVMSLSKGKPKNTDALERTVYLRIRNNKVSDIIGVRTKDNIPVTIKLSFVVNFTGEDQAKWFECDNYVKYLCDHVRSVLKGAIQKKTIEDFDANQVELIRDTILGASVNGSRPGMKFAENGMVVTEVEILEVVVDDPQISQMLNAAKHQVVASNIQLSQAEKTLEVTQRQEEIKRETATAIAATVEHTNNLTKEELGQKLAVKLEQIRSELEASQKQEAVEIQKQKTLDLTKDAELARSQKLSDQSQAIAETESQRKLRELKAEAEAIVTKFTAASGGFSEALLAMQSQETLAKVAEALSVQRLIGGNNAVDAFFKMFEGTPLATYFTKAQERIAARDGGNGSARPAIPSAVRQ